MKSATLEAAPAARAAATPTPSPELIPHAWDDQGKCTNPEALAIDFGAKAKGSSATILLASDDEGRWHYGYEATPKGGAPSSRAVLLDVDSHEDRPAALRAALVTIGSLFNKAKDKKGAATIEGYYDAHFAANGAACSPANNGAAVLPAPAHAFPVLPRGKFEPELPIAQIQRNPEQPRRSFDPIALRELAESMRGGQLQPIAVRRLLSTELGEFPEVAKAAVIERYELILGERRWRAKQLLGETTIEAKVYEGLTRAQAKAAALIENLQRENLNPIEEAEGFRDLMATENLTQEQCAQRVGRSRPVVANALRVLELPAKALDLIREKKLTIAHGVALARFKAWPKVVEALATIAAKEQSPASFLEKGLPFASHLVSDGLAARVEYWKFDHEPPAALKKSPALIKDGEYSHYFLEPAVYAEALKQHEATKRAAEEAEREKARKKAEAAAKNPARIKSLQDLPRNAFTEVSEESQALLALVPDATVHEVKGYDNEKVTICTKPDLFRKIESEVAELKKADRLAKLPPLLDQARARIAKTKKIGPRELTLLLLLAQTNEDDNVGFTVAAAKRQGVKLPSAFTPNEWHRLEIGKEGLKLIGKEDPVALYRVLADECLARAIAEDPWGNVEVANFDQEPDSAAGEMLRHLLEIDELGLLEETKAGQKQLLETVKTAEWYKKALAAIEAEEAKESKSSKKGGK